MKYTRKCDEFQHIAYFILSSHPSTESKEQHENAIMRRGTFPTKASPMPLSLPTPTVPHQPLVTVYLQTPTVTSTTHVIHHRFAPISEVLSAPAPPNNISHDVCLSVTATGSTRPQKFYCISFLFLNLFPSQNIHQAAAKKSPGFNTPSFLSCGRIPRDIHCPERTQATFETLDS